MAGEVLRRFHFTEAELVLAEYADEPVRILLPPVLGEEPAEPPGTQLILLVQAGATALGVWEDEELVAHKVIRKYVVRGRGKAQPLHRKTRGKSRYGSRLRLQGARKQLEETVAKVRAFHREFGPFRRVFRSCPVRLWASYRNELAQLIEGPEPRKIPRDVRVPNHAELLRVRRFLEWGRVEAL